MPEPQNKPDPAAGSTAPTGAKSMDDLMALCKRRGFIYQASEIYGGLNGFWDYGPLGAQLKKNLRDAWWQDMILNPCWGRKGPDFGGGGDRVRCVPVETCIIQHPKVWEASGHLAGFNDPRVDCKACKSRFRADQLFAVGWFPASEVERLGELISDKGLPERLQRAIIELQDFTQRASRKTATFTDSTLDFDLSASMPKLFCKVVIASGEAEALTVAHLTKREQASLGETLPPDVRRLGTVPGWWPQLPCPNCGVPGQLTDPRQFNLMFKTTVGATGGDDDAAYLRPETAQGIFVQFKNVVDTTRVKLPFGIGNTGKSFRNEITPRNFTYRSREFEQMELEFFCHPGESQAWYAFWRDFRMEWWKSLGLAGENLRLREHAKDELSHYSTGTSDVEYRFPFTYPDFGELEGIAHRGCFDLEQHQKHSGAKLEYFDQERGEKLPNGSTKGERYMPHVIEPAAGLDRGVLAVLCESYTKDPSRPSPEIMRFHPRLAPIKAAVFPLVNKEGMPEVAEKLYDELHARFGRGGFIETDAKQSIGKRYARMDEAGCPFCFTIDGQTLTDQTVTVRDRDTGAQERIALGQVTPFLTGKLGG